MKKLIPLFFFLFAFNLLNGQIPEFWGMTFGGGSNYGIIYKTDENCENQQVKYDFQRNPGKSPQFGHLCECGGKLYGLTKDGGPDMSGVLFEYDPVIGKYQNKIFFSGLNGFLPMGSLMKASNGKLYGMTSQGGAAYSMGTPMNFGYGVLFEYTPATGAYIIKHEFTGLNGSLPYGSLIEVSPGILYGMTSEGGADWATADPGPANVGYGVIFKYSISSGTYLKVFDFDGADHGSAPKGSLMMASDGKLYGMTKTGGEWGGGCIFDFDPNGKGAPCTRRYSFWSPYDGSIPFGDLVQSGNKLYGLTSIGGGYVEPAGGNGGTLFEFDITPPEPPAPVIIVVKSKFDNTILENGYYPYGSLVLANGKLYGMTYQGGIAPYYGGVLFEYDIAAGTRTKKVDFDQTTNGGYPLGSLMMASNGKMYGMTSDGATGQGGVIFDYVPGATTVTKLIDFNDPTKGLNPQGSCRVTQADYSAFVP
ncbi:MAG: choice-of-anchor tandem repeat GloVer-containing protein [Bacteroidota bacterium]